MEVIFIVYLCNSLPKSRRIRYKGSDRVVSLPLGTATESCVPTCQVASSVSPGIPELTSKGHRTVFTQLAMGRVSQQDEQVKSRRSRSSPSVL